MLEKVLEENKFKMNLQLFADGDNPNDTPDDTPDNPDDTKNDNPDTPDNVDNPDDPFETGLKGKELQSFLDKKITQALKTAEENRKKAEAEEEKKKIRLKDLDGKDRELEELKIKMEELDKREQEVRLKELEVDTVASLKEQNLPISFSKWLMGEDAEKTKENIEDFKKQWTEALEKARIEQVATGNLKRDKSETGNYGAELAKKTQRVVKDNPWY